MNRSPAELALEYLYMRTYGTQFVARVSSVLLVAVASAYCHIFSFAVAPVWLIAYAACELVIVWWWRGLRGALGTLTDADAHRQRDKLIRLSCLTSVTAASPFLFNFDPGVSGAAVSVVVTGGIIMILAAQRVVDEIFLWTAPVPALALIVNLTHLGQGIESWILAALGICFVANARQLQSANTAAEAQMLTAQVEADRANKAKSVFLATISHEIRTPLNGVLGMAQAMRLDALSPAQLERLDIVQRSGEVLLALLNDLLDMAKIEAGRVVLEQVDFDLGAILRGAYDTFRVVSGEKGLTMTLAMQGGAAEDDIGVFHGDPTRVRQIIYNLLSNAVKFTEHGAVSMTARRHAAGFQLSVADTGIGMTQDTAEHIFEKFTQADASTSRQFGGTGLGLSICRDLAMLMGGSITVDSAVGRGSTFTVDLPLRYIGPAAPRPVPPCPGDVAAPTRSVEPLRVLIADDNDINRKVLRSLLTASGNLDLKFVEDGAAAVDAWEARDWDLILMDINMPVMSGVAATQRIRARELEIGRPRTLIIALTANAMSHQTEEYLAAGMDGNFAKPFNVPALFALLADVAASRIKGRTRSAGCAISVHEKLENSPGGSAGRALVAEAAQPDADFERSSPS